jgi:hypothetical protein
VVPGAAVARARAAGPVAAARMGAVAAVARERAEPRAAAAAVARGQAASRVKAGAPREQPARREQRAPPARQERPAPLARAVVLPRAAPPAWPVATPAPTPRPRATARQTRLSSTRPGAVAAAAYPTEHRAAHRCSLASDSCSWRDRDAHDGGERDPRAGTMNVAYGDTRPVSIPRTSVAAVTVALRVLDRPRFASFVSPTSPPRNDPAAFHAFIAARRRRVTACRKIRAARNCCSIQSWADT